MGVPTRKEERTVLRVLDVVLAARRLLEQGLPDVWVEGEISDRSESASGHLYFTLNDGGPLDDAKSPPRPGRAPEAQIKCVVFLSDRPLLRASLEQGERVRVRGRASATKQRSTLQLIVSAAVPVGLGDRHAELAKLRQKLMKEGLFDPARKRPLPRVPRVVGLVTSKNGAAILDVVKVARARLAVRIIVAHCLVQGPDAPGSIVRGLDALGKVPGLDVVIIARGGGASDDLSAFDDENVVRAIVRCPVPVVTGVGHEVDITLADLAADRRASTPSNAAEIVVPDGAKLRADLRLWVRRLSQGLDGRVRAARALRDRLDARLTNRRASIFVSQGEVKALRDRLERASRKLAERRRARLAELVRRLGRADPRARLHRARASLASLSPALQLGMRASLRRRRDRLAALALRSERSTTKLLAKRRSELAVLVGRLDALSPVAVLSRGYAIALHAKTGRALTRAEEAEPGDVVRVRLADGVLVTRVDGQE
jgi:exodeoxyribonuclease VII large subunit